MSLGKQFTNQFTSNQPPSQQIRPNSRATSPWRMTARQGGTLGALMNPIRETAPSQAIGAHGYPALGQSMSLHGNAFQQTGFIEDPNQLMLKEIAPEVNAQRLQQEREDERIINQLRQEFAKIDISQDGSITIDEIRQFLQVQGPKGGIDTGIAEQIFHELDDDGSGAVMLQEFVENYFVKQRLLKQRIVELETNLTAHTKSREDLMFKLRELRNKEKLNAFGLD